ncbi:MULTISPECIES: hypothetical protein [unclassified Caballeronia]|nr:MULTISPECIES: hypothetical protein [unclassified Caballeronia]MDR5749790.1 hypothetical protein [Caballeronia sp. LZ024]MDR5843082.1 hypothetical protein [Caballeronia sp. LZ031]
MQADLLDEEHGNHSRPRSALPRDETEIKKQAALIELTKAWRTPP